MATFSILDNLYVASPCDASWDDMQGDARARHCGDCDQHVYDLSGLTRQEAEALLIEKRGRLCVRYFRRPDGRILTKDCPVGAAKLRRRVKLAAWAAAGAAVTAVGVGVAHFASLACGASVGVELVGPRPTMGEPPPVAEMGKVAR